MKERFSSVGGGMEIKLHFQTVMTQLEQAKTYLAQLELPKPTDTYGRNELLFTEEWLEREALIHDFLLQYMDVVEKNLADTKENIRMLKEQDEVIGT
ncbi:YwqI/YxiC family protein [Paraliobacillus ryukyuensis]|uniref:YwqI/YxiC family protein n=1 Tax=Paraliobacillus ryukyuensis TaxID=200904 RepID=UPI0009A907FB|nr:YwqI/YxiC family protein [Paraliobacillus ryukyuensis]